MEPKQFKHGYSGYTNHKCRCDVCKGASAAYNKEWSVKNKERRTKYKAMNFNKNREENLAKKRAYRLANKDKISAYNKEYHINNSDDLSRKAKMRNEINREKRLKHLAEYLKHRYQNDPLFKLANDLRGRINSALKRGNGKKAYSTIELIGCSVLELKNHLENQFKNGMTWSDRGAWHIDHMKPCCSFDLSDPEEQKKCFHFSNLQPLWKAENLNKQKKSNEDWIQKQNHKRTVLQELAQ